MRAGSIYPAYASSVACEVDIALLDGLVTDYCWDLDLELGKRSYVSAHLVNSLQCLADGRVLLPGGKNLLLEAVKKRKVKLEHKLGLIEQEVRRGKLSSEEAVAQGADAERLRDELPGLIQALLSWPEADRVAVPAPEQIQRPALDDIGR